MASVREQVKRLVAEGLSASEIARRLEVATTTVSYHLTRLEQANDEPAFRSERKAPTVERVRQLLGAGMSHAEISRALGVSKSTVAYHARRLGAPMDERCSRRYDWDEIQRFYDEGHTVRECRLRFGFTGATWNAAVRRGAVKGRDRKLPLSELLVADTYRGRHNLRLRLISEGVKKAACERCGLTEWRGGPVPLALHHVNGDRLDNRLDNLELLCMNCHGQTPNFSGRRRTGHVA